MTDDTRDRLIALEVEFKHMNDTLEGMRTQIEEMHSLLLQAKGAKWLLLILVTGLGFLAGKVGGVLAWLGLVK